MAVRRGRRHVPAKVDHNTTFPHPSKRNGTARTRVVGQLRRIHCVPAAVAVVAHLARSSRHGRHGCAENAAQCTGIRADGPPPLNSITRSRSYAHCTPSADTLRTRQHRRAAGVAAWHPFRNTATTGPAFFPCAPVGPAAQLSTRHPTNAWRTFPTLSALSHSFKQLPRP